MEFMAFMALVSVFAALLSTLLKGRARFIVPAVLGVICLLIWITMPPPGGEYFEDGVEVIPGLAHGLFLYGVFAPALIGSLVGVMLRLRFGGLSSGRDEGDASH